MAQGVTNAISTGNLATNIVLGASLKLLWGLINTLQYIVFFGEWENLCIPANAKTAIEMAREIALGEFIPTDWYSNHIEELTAVAKDEDGSTNVLASMGLVLIVLAAILVIILPVLFCIRSS